MSERRVEKARKIQGLINNLLLKHACVFGPKPCDNCKQPSENWFVIGVCHHTVCRECAAPDSTCCPVCSSEFDPEKDVSTYEEMKIAYSQMDEFVHTLTSEEAIKPGIVCTESVKSSQENSISQPTHSAHNDSQLSTDLTGYEVEEIQFPEKANCMEQSVKFKPIYSGSDRDKEQTKENIDVDDQEKQLETLNGYQEHDMNHEQSRDSNSSSSTKSEEDSIEGAPKRIRASSSFNQQKRNIVITYSNFFTMCSEIGSIRKLAHMFDLSISREWSDTITHLVVKVDNNDIIPARTVHFITALLSDCYIVTMKWVNDCLKSKSLLSEIGYMPLDVSGDPSPMMSWRVRRGIIDSPMDWTRNYVLYLHDSVKYMSASIEIVGWIKKSNFVLIDKIEDFINHEYKIKCILVFNKSAVGLPSVKEIRNWFEDYNAETISFDWLLECLGRYKFVEVTCEYEVLNSDPNVNVSIIQH